jgi:2-oxoglutarate ferredoxin oxidoreductase subunit beta
MTGGQMAPTTLSHMVTTTTPYGRDEKLEGYPIKISEMIALTKGAVYIERTAVNSPTHIQRTKRAIRKAFQAQKDGKGYALVEVLSPCPTNWKMGVVEAWKWIDDVMVKEFPLGVIKDTTGEKSAD